MLTLKTLSLLRYPQSLGYSSPPPITSCADLLYACCFESFSPVLSAKVIEMTHPLSKLQLRASCCSALPVSVPPSQLQSTTTSTIYQCLYAHIAHASTWSEKVIDDRTAAEIMIDPAGNVRFVSETWHGGANPRTPTSSKSAHSKTTITARLASSAGPSCLLISAWLLYTK